MISQESNISLNEANRELLNAENELSRPHEDVVTLSACQSVRAAMTSMLRTYLSEYALVPSNNPSLNDLIEASKKVNSNFAYIDLRNVECKGVDHAHCGGKYCLSIENVSSCLAAAHQIRNIVWKEFSLN
jgi:hypothetical protein